MGDSMTPSKPITKGQAGKFVDVFVDALVKSGLPSEATQEILETQGAALADECLAMLRKRVEMKLSTIVRRVKVDRSLVPQRVLDATGRAQYTTQSVVDAMPGGEGEEVDVHVFKIDPSFYKNGWISDDDVAKQYEMRGLKSDPYAQAALNRDDPAFADDHPNGCHWKDAQGKWCFAAFGRWRGGRRVRVRRHDFDWHDDWSFVGVPRK